LNIVIIVKTVQKNRKLKVQVEALITVGMEIMKNALLLLLVTLKLKMKVGVTVKQLLMGSVILIPTLTVFLIQKHVDIVKRILMILRLSIQFQMPLQVHIQPKEDGPKEIQIFMEITIVIALVNQIITVKDIRIMMNTSKL